MDEKNLTVCHHINLDTTTLIAYASQITWNVEDCLKRGFKDVLLKRKFQLNEEMNHTGDVLRDLHLLKDGVNVHLYITPQALSEIRSIMKTMAGPIERDRLETLLSRVSLLVDENLLQNIVWIPDTREENNLPSTQLTLKRTKNITNRHIAIFGGAIQAGIVTYSSDYKFVSACLAQKLDLQKRLLVKLHRPRSLMTL